MSDRKVFFIDIDGTLIYKDNKLPSKKDIESIKRLKELGHKVVLCSGRAPSQMSDINKAIGNEDFISCNGQFVFYEGVVIYDNPIPMSDIKKIDKLIRQYDIPTFYQGLEKYSLDSDRTLCERIESFFKPYGVKPYVYYEKDFQFNNSIYTLSFAADEKTEKYLEPLRDTFAFSRSHEFALYAVLSGNLKADGIKKFIEYVGIDVSDTVCIGDEDNDYDMFKFCNYSIAMGNAKEQLKNIADYITLPVEESGVTHALEELKYI